MFETEEQPTLHAVAPEPFDRPTWAHATVHPDHHIQFRRALYSVPTRYIGQVVDIRGDSRLEKPLGETFRETTGISPGLIEVFP